MNNTETANKLNKHFATIGITLSEKFNGNWTAKEKVFTTHIDMQNKN